ncbi:MAG: 30S ribosomal protein S6 [Candidatus Pacebacteria bacterium]|nr:30S ribosomal protein S6 [Candidatus Paceibacterota bacterium]
MNYYELTYLALISLTPEELEEIQTNIEKLVKLEKKEKPIKKPLAYLIKGENQAFLVSVFFNAESITELREYVKKEKRILRHLLIKTKPYKEEKKRREKPKKSSIFRSSEKSKVELSEIDKKIEEILQD